MIDLTHSRQHATGETLMIPRSHTWIGFVASVLLGHAVPAAALEPSTVTITGDLQSELGCPGDYSPDCAVTKMTQSAGDDIWRFAATLPAGSYSYFAALNGSSEEAYGRNGGPPINAVTLNLPAETDLKFYYNDTTHWVTDSITSAVAVLAGSFQSELGCAGDFQPDCLRSWLQDLDGDGIYKFETTLPVGAYSTVVAINESFDETYSRPGGGNYEFTATDDPVRFAYDGRTHLLTIDTGAVPEPSSWILMISGFALAAAMLRRRKGAMRYQSLPA